MRIRRHAFSCTLILLLASAGCDAKGPGLRARDRLASILGDSLGAATDPKVALITDGGARESHLYLHFDTTAFANLSDSAFELRAQDVGRFAMRHYENARALDSITVAARESVTPNSARLYHMRTFSVAQLRE